MEVNIHFNLEWSEEGVELIEMYPYWSASLDWILKKRASEFVINLSWRSLIIP